MSPPPGQGENAFSRALRAFEVSFRGSARFVASAPGRVNLIGDHTDYCGGLVMPMAIDRRCFAVGRFTAGDSWRIIASDIDQSTFEYEPKDSLEGAPSWMRYVAGVIEIIGGTVGAKAMEIAVASEVPMGAGLSSSAALEVSIATLIEQTSGCEIDKLEKARLCQRAEREYAGVPCGIMDQMASIYGDRGHAMLIDCCDLSVTQIPLWDEARVRLFVVESGVRHDLAQGEYAARRASCESAAQALGLDSLRGADEALVVSHAEDLTTIQFGAARHVTSENTRVAAAAALLEQGQFDELGRLMLASHRSLRDDMDVSCPELDRIVETAAAVPGVLGARMTGGGFGGSAIVLARAEVEIELRDALQASGHRCMRVRSGNGAFAEECPLR